MQNNMSKNIVSLVLVFLFATISIINARSLKSSDNGGAWNAITNINDPHVKEIAEFAVSEYNKQQTARFELVNIFEGDIQNNEGGKKYRLIIYVKANGGNAETYYTEVLENKSTKQLLKFFPGRVGLLS
ncbi:cysteine proteinase inhibitor 4-like [Silene latifolia]|uniref:cysteine proteinase inhibitor 4-like n=1 Tax=Silene latifolia TaxID=37657 RepID=UPI003D783673